MRRLITILLLSIQFLQLEGYFLQYAFLNHRVEKYFDDQSAKGLYYKSDLVEIKIPVYMPGVVDWVRYEAINGCIQFGENTYNYVKMRITRNTMFLMCVPHYNSAHLNTFNKIDAKGIPNIPVPKKSHTPDVKLQTLQKFESITPAYNFEPPVKLICFELPIHLNFYSGAHKDTPEQPPKASC